MKKIEQHIFELLFQHDCVVLPGLGGFVADYRSAWLDDQSKKIFPPSKSFIFNRHLLNNDGLLAHKIVDAEGCNYEEAIQKINAFVSSVLSTLSTEKRYEFDQVGIVYIDAQKNIRFKSSKTNFLMNSFGLPVVKAIPIVQELPIEQTEFEKVTKVKPIEIIHESSKLPEEAKVIPIQQAGRNRRNYWWAAAVAIPVLFYSAWIPMKTDLLKGNGEFQYSDLNPFTFHKDKVYYKQNYVLTEIEKAGEMKPLQEQFGDNAYGIYPIDDAESYVVIKLREELIPEAETTYVEKTEIKEVKIIKKGYHLIGGCFGKKENADSFVEEMRQKGYNAFILDENKGLHRVSISQLDSKSEAKQLKSELKNTEDISTWVLKK